MTYPIFIIDILPSEITRIFGQIPGFSSQTFGSQFERLIQDDVIFRRIKLDNLDTSKNSAAKIFYSIKGGYVDSRFYKDQNYITPLYSEWDENHPIAIITSSIGMQIMIELLILLESDAFPNYTTSTLWIKNITGINGCLNGIYVDLPFTDKKEVMNNILRPLPVSKKFITPYRYKQNNLTFKTKAGDYASEYNYQKESLIEKIIGEKLVKILIDYTFVIAYRRMRRAFQLGIFDLKEDKTRIFNLYSAFPFEVMSNYYTSFYYRYKDTGLLPLYNGIIQNTQFKVPKLEDDFQLNDGLLNKASMNFYITSHYLGYLLPSFRCDENFRKYLTYVQTRYKELPLSYQRRNPDTLADQFQNFSISSYISLFGAKGNVTDEMELLKRYNNTIFYYMSIDTSNKLINNFLGSITDDVEDDVLYNNNFYEYHVRNFLDIPSENVNNLIRLSISFAVGIFPDPEYNL